MTGDLVMLHRRLAARLRRQVEKADRLGVTNDRARKIRRTVTDMVVVERLQDMDPLRRATVESTPVLMAKLRRDAEAEVPDRLQKMTPGAGLVIGR